MTIFKVKVIKDYKKWRLGVQSFLDELTKNGYKWRDVKKDVKIYIDDVVVYLSERDWTKNEYWHGSYYTRYMNIGFKKNKMFRIRAFLSITGNVSEYQKGKLNVAIGILKRAQDFQPDFEYDFD